MACSPFPRPSSACHSVASSRWCGHLPELRHLHGTGCCLGISLSQSAFCNVVCDDEDHSRSGRFFVFLLGVYDDVRGVGPYVKFTVQAIAASMLYAGGLRIINIPVLFGDRPLPSSVELLFTVIWVLAITNAFNLIDGLDGLAAGSALFSTMVAFVLAVFHGPVLVEVMTIALAGAILGFLRFNFNPATIFLGDSGSLFIGFLLSALALHGAQKAPTIVAVAIPIVSLRAADP